MLKLTCPPRTSRRKALEWAAGQSAWIEQQIARACPREPFVHNTRVPIAGEDVRLIWDANASRAPQFAQGELRCGGPEAGFARRIENFLKRLALETMSSEVAEFSLKAAANVKAVSIGDAMTRWGSCSSGQRIRLNWRLILAPPEARRYVVAHEVAHLIHLNHGPEFKALEAELFGGDVATTRATLTRIGTRLRGIGRGS